MLHLTQVFELWTFNRRLAYTRNNTPTVVMMFMAEEGSLWNFIMTASLWHVPSQTSRLPASLHPKQALNQLENGMEHIVHHIIIIVYSTPFRKPTPPEARVNYIHVGKWHTLHLSSTLCILSFIVYQLVNYTFISTVLVCNNKAQFRSLKCSICVHIQWS